MIRFNAKLLTLPALAILALLLTACPSGGAGSRATVDSVTISGVPSSRQIAAGETLDLSASVSGSAGVSQAVTWASNDTGIATVTGAGVVTGVSAGTATITATSQADGSASDSVTLTILAGNSVVHVDAQNGSDANDGFSESEALKTLTEAFTRIADDAGYAQVETVKVYPGTYNQAGGETFPLEVPAGLTVTGESTAEGDEVHILSPDVAELPAVRVAEGATLRDLSIENGYTGDNPSGYPDALYIMDGSTPDAPAVQLQNLELSLNNGMGVMLSVGSDATVTVTDTSFDGRSAGAGFSYRFNESDSTVTIENSSFTNIADGHALDLGNAGENRKLTLKNVSIKPSPDGAGSAIQFSEGGVTLVLDKVTITSSDGTAFGGRFEHAIGDVLAESVTTVKDSNFSYFENQIIVLRGGQTTITGSVLSGASDSAYGAIHLMDGSLKLRDTTIRDNANSGILLWGPSDDYPYVVDLGTAADPGNNTFSNNDGFDVRDGRGRNAAEGQVGEISAIGNTWSSGGQDAVCDTTFGVQPSEDIFVKENVNSVRYGAGTGETCVGVETD